jgi:uncharacterized membrane protein YqhA
VFKERPGGHDPVANLGVLDLTIDAGSEEGERLARSQQHTDVFLLGTVLFIVAFGLYQLFIQPDLPVPAWLKIQNLDQLTERLIEVVGVLLSVTLLAVAAEGVMGASLLELGVSVAIVIAALSLLLVVSHRRPANHG